jgi:tyrosinase
LACIYQKWRNGRTNSSREYLGNAPVFSNTTGFSGNGDPNGLESVSDAHCVTDGPFADLQLPFYDGDEHVHCLSRGFKFNQKMLHGRIPGEGVRPSAIEKILSLPDFESFFLALENGPYNAIPTGIHGDFMGFTAPNDPISSCIIGNSTKTHLEMRRKC